MRNLNSVYVLCGPMLALTIGLAWADDNPFDGQTPNISPALRTIYCSGCTPAMPIVQKEEFVYDNACWEQDHDKPHRHITFLCRKQECTNGWYYLRYGDSPEECSDEYMPAWCPGGTCVPAP